MVKGRCNNGIKQEKDTLVIKNSRKRFMENALVENALLIENKHKLA